MQICRLLTRYSDLFAVDIELKRQGSLFALEHAGKCPFLILFFLPCSQTAKMTEKKAVIKNADMSDEMQQDAVDCAMQAMEKYNIEKDIAAYVKKVYWMSIVQRCDVFNWL